MPLPPLRGFWSGACRSIGHGITGLSALSLKSVLVVAAILGGIVGTVGWMERRGRGTERRAEADRSAAAAGNAVLANEGSTTEESKRMIDLYTWSTPNGRKISIMLEETGLPYAVHPIDLGRGMQHEPAFVAINPNAKIPAIIDPEGPDGKPIRLFESGAILIYLAEKSGRLLPAAPRARYETLQWLMFQMGGVGPIFGQAHHFLRYAPEPVPYAIERFRKETRRLYGVLDARLAEAPYLAAGEYTIADVATYPWVARFEWHQVDLAEFPNVRRWFDELGRRPAVQKGMKVPA